MKTTKLLIAAVAALIAAHAAAASDIVYRRDGNVLRVLGKSYKRVLTDSGTLVSAAEIAMTIKDGDRSTFTLIVFGCDPVGFPKNSAPLYVILEDDDTPEPWRPGGRKLLDQLAGDVCAGAANTPVLMRRESADKPAPGSQQPARKPGLLATSWAAR